MFMSAKIFPDENLRSRSSPRSSSTTTGERELYRGLHKPKANAREKALVSMEKTSLMKKD